MNEKPCYRVAISFGSHDFYNSLARHVAELEATGLFQKVIGYTHKDFDTDFLRQHRKFIVKNKRGYGYWIWKPYLILKTLETMEDGQTLLYSDAGCTLVHEYCELFREFLEDFERSGKCMNMASQSMHDTTTLIKADLFQYLDIDMQSFAGRVEIESGRLLFRRCQATLDFVRKWYEISCADNYHYLDDTPSEMPNSANFIEHRHDQSILTVLCYKYNYIPFGNYLQITQKVWISSRRRD